MEHWSERTTIWSTSLSYFIWTNKTHIFIKKKKLFLFKIILPSFEMNLFNVIICIKW